MIDWILYLTARALIGVIRLLPLPMVAHLGRVGGALFYYLDSRHRRVAIRNIGRCFPEKSKTEVREIAWENFKRIGEAFASAAHDQGFARLFGQKTAGCLAGASTYRLADGSAMQITIWKIVSPQRREINQTGQQPDEEIAPDPTGATDPVLDGAIHWLVTQAKP